MNNEISSDLNDRRLTVVAQLAEQGQRLVVGRRASKHFAFFQRRKGQRYETEVVAPLKSSPNSVGFQTSWGDLVAGELGKRFTAVRMVDEAGRRVPGSRVRIAKGTWIIAAPKSSRRVFVRFSGPDAQERLVPFQRSSR